MTPFSVLLATPRGFCAGVDRAIEVVRMALARFGSPVYVRHAIVHNRNVVETLKREGAIFVEDTEEIPEGSTAVFSAHGVSPKVRRKAGARNLHLIDATCPLVTKVHHEAVRFAEAGMTILLIGHRGHPEVEGTMGEAPDRIHLVESAADAAVLSVDDPERVAVITQTTLSLDDTRDIMETILKRFPSAASLSRNDICYATQNRQEAVKRLADKSNPILVIGSPASSNSNRLREVALREGVRAYLIEDADEIDPEWLQGAHCVGVTAGASTPESLVENVVARLRELGASEVLEIEGRRESVKFRLPAELEG